MGLYLDLGSDSGMSVAIKHLVDELLYLLDVLHDEVHHVAHQGVHLDCLLHYQALQKH